MAIMPFSSTFKLIAVCGALGILANCDTTNTRSEKPNNIIVRSTESGLTGHYNATAFSAQEARDVIRYVCDGKRLASFGETPDDGLMRFSATCSDRPIRDDERFFFHRHEGAPVESKLFGVIEDGDVYMTYIFSDSSGRLASRDILIRKNGEALGL